MKKINLIKSLSIYLLSIVLITMTLTGCSNNTTVTDGKNTETEKKTIIIGTGNDFKPYCYLDENNNPIGFEIEVLKEINKRLPQYKFEFQAMEFKNILLSLESSKIDVATHQYAKNPDREQKYLFANEGYTSVATKITVAKDNKDIKSIDDLNGKQVQVSAGSNDAAFLEKYNKEHGNKINLIYGKLDNATLVSSLETGRIDASTNITRNVDAINKTYGDKIKTIGAPLYDAYTYHIFRNDETQLRDEFDKAIKEMKNDGTLSKLSIDILGADYTK